MNTEEIYEAAFIDELEKIAGVKEDAIGYLAKAVSKKNAAKEALGSSRSKYKSLRDAAKGNEVFSSWGRKAYKNNKDWEPSSMLKELKGRKAKMKSDQKKYVGFRDINKYKRPQQVNQGS